MPDWTQLTIAGFRHLSDGSHVQAAFAWLRAVEFYVEAGDDDPSCATAHNNAGVAYSLLGQDSEARGECRTAKKKWTHALMTVTSLDVPITSGSSSFHFRLASRSLDAFSEVHRRKYDARCRTSIAITQFNSVIASAAQFSDERIRIQAKRLQSLTTDAYGQNSPESQLLLAIAEENQSFNASLFRDKMDRIERKLARGSNRGSDRCFSIEIAAELMAISPRRHLPRKNLSGDAQTLPLSNIPRADHDAR